MKVSDLVKELNLTVFCGEAGLDAEISGGYTSDLLSDVMGHIDEGMLWVTMQTHQNIVAVATLKDAAADRKSTRLNSSHASKSRMPSSA